jgi:glycosyltransferase involved in cell wall biosynthesis
MNEAPRVTVVVPVFNGVGHVGDAIASVRSQTMRDFELVVVDDGSTDRTSELIEEEARRDPRIVQIRQANAGLPAARNAGIAAASGELIAFLDADDVWLPQKLELQTRFLAEHSECEACFTQFEEINDELETVTSWTGLQEKYRRESVGAYELVESGNVVAGSGSSVMARVTAIREAGAFDDRLVACEDLDLWYRLALRAPLHAVPAVLVRIRVAPTQMQADFGRVLVGRIQFLENVVARGDPSHRELAAAMARRIRRQLFLRSVRRGRLRRALFALV